MLGSVTEARAEWEGVVEHLWAPWRMRYVGGEAHDPACIFCTKPARANDVDDLILYRGEHAFVIMNLFPYNTGHVMVVPNRHVADLSELDPLEVSGLFGLLPWITAAQRRVLHCEGLNIGLNLGSVAGAGIAAHLHVHVVPRWEGDANFMPIIADTMVLPELLPVTYAKLRAEIELSELARGASDLVVPQAGAVVLVPSLGKVAVRRAADGTMVLPKGHIEPGEAAWETAVREVQEEMGLRAQVAGWAGMMRFPFGRRERLVAYLITTAEPDANFVRHLDTDTFLLTPAEAAAALSHESARELLDVALQRAGSLLGVAG